MRVLFVSNSGFQYLASVIPALNRQGVEHQLLSLEDLREKQRHFRRTKSRWLKKYYFDSAFTAAFRAALDAFNPDVMHVTGLRSTLIKSLVACRTHPDMAIVHERISAGGMNVASPLDWMLFNHRRIDRIVMPSHAMLNNWVGNPFLRAYMPHGRYEVLHYAFDLPPLPSAQEKQALRAALGLPADAFIVGTVCYVRPWKYVEFVAQAVAAIRSDREICFAVVGPPSRDERYMEIVRRAGGSRLKLLGRIPNASKIMYAFDLYTTPTRLPGGESFGMAFAEAMAYGVPGITMNYGASAEVCESGVSGYALPESVSAWQRTIEMLIQDPDRLRQLGVAARQRIAERFSPQDRAREYLRVYETTIAERRHKGSAGGGR